jgi:hypothetical protein
MATIRNVQPKGGFNKPYVLLKSKNMAPEVRAAKWKKPRPIAPRLRLWPRQARRQREGGAIVRTAPGDRVERAAAQVEERVDRTSFRPASAARRPPRWPRRRGARPRGEGREKGAHGPCVLLLLPSRLFLLLLTQTQHAKRGQCSSLQGSVLWTRGWQSPHETKNSCIKSCYPIHRDPAESQGPKARKYLWRIWKAAGGAGAARRRRVRRSRSAEMTI